MIAEEIKVPPNISKTFWDGIMEIEYEYKSWYEKNPTTFIQFLQKFESPKAILMLIYNRSVREGLKPIENLETEEKRSLVNEAGREINVCKALYVIKN